VLASLKWLARHQERDGSWSVLNHVEQCNAVRKGSCGASPGRQDFTPGVTGLALLAFLGAGYTHISRDAHDGIVFGDVVRRGLQWIMTRQDAEGCVGPRTAAKYLYNHVLCALALSEAYGMTASTLFKDAAQRAVDFTVAAQNPGKGWRYAIRPGESDTSVTGWAVMVLKSAEIAGLEFPRGAYDGARKWLDEVTGDDFRAGYRFKGSGKTIIRGDNELFSHHETMTAVAVMARTFMDRRRDATIAGGCALLARDEPEWDGGEADFMFWYAAALALYTAEGPSSALWRRWNEKLKTTLVPRQRTRRDGCADGSWDPVDRWSGEGGRVYATAINALTLEVYYRYVSAFTGGSR
jgi:hypothetical protein